MDVCVWVGEWGIYAATVEENFKVAVMLTHKLPEVCSLGASHGDLQEMRQVRQRFGDGLPHALQAKAMLMLHAGLLENLPAHPHELLCDYLYAGGFWKSECRPAEEESPSLS